MTDMSNSKHTPGPWRIAHPKLTGRRQEGDRLIVGPDNEHVAEAFQYQSHTLTDSKQSDANARLIAAAPDLLAALKWIERDCVNDTPEMWMAVKAAIAKTEGKE